MDSPDPLLSELCSICHVNPPKYRCPRCSTRTCSLPCTRRHKLWSQCSGVRDPAAYLKRNELTTETAFDRDFNFITGIERSMERADRDAENRGIDLARGTGTAQNAEEDTAGPSTGQKRKHPQQGLVKGEASFLRGAEAGLVNVIRAPRGMTRNKLNNSRWHPKHKCLSWSVEWISKDGEKILRNCLENCSIAESYDRGFPPPKQEKIVREQPSERQNEQEGGLTQEEQQAEPGTGTGTVATGDVESTNTQPEKSSAGAVEVSTNASEEKEKVLPIGPHRNLYFYLHRPRTTVKKPVLVPLAPRAMVAAALRERTVLEFPTIYTLLESPDELLKERETSPFMLEEDYIRSVGPEDAAEKSAKADEDEVDSQELPGPSVDLQNLDEQKVLEVLKQDLFEPES
ncbi:Zinc finger HIT-type [Penicillium angulare]|uniref:Zinc finger HIT-type n=1 Tax=Penicillium angulare TaxID=116970 RepID=UPI0025408313|nr:Zinc finger HIT-type [Penicillium angulare]KAJ5279225.1 Zinc finger HIT-type [Penicillium angulare]